MRAHSRGCGRSVDRGTRGPGIEPRNPCPAARAAGCSGCRGGGDTPKATPCLPHWRGRQGPRAVRDPAHARKHLDREPGDPASFCHALGSAGCRAHRKAQGRTAMSDGHGKSDCCVVPEKPPNKAVGETPAAAGVVEGRQQAKGNAVAARMSRRASRVYDVGTALDGIRQTAKGRRDARFDNLMHHIYAVEQLEQDFLGITHCCGKTRKGKFMVLRLTSGKRLRAKLLAVKTELRKRMHQPIAEQGKYLRAVVAGHGRYFAVPCNGARVQAFRFQVGRLWHRTLCRRSQIKHLSWKRMHKIVAHWLPSPRICHPYPNQRLIVTTQGRSRMR